MLRVLATLFVLVAAPASASPQKPTYSFGGLAGYEIGHVLEHDVSGPSIKGYGVLRLGVVSFGLRAAIASLDGTYRVTTRTVNVAMTQVSAGVYLQATAFDRLWSGVSLGVDLADIDDELEPIAFKTGFNVGLDLGVDVLRFGKHRVVVFGRAETQLGSSIDYAALTVGAGYRLY
jgi:hypothetical protein